MQLPIKGRREKESISEIQSKPTPADVTAKTALISHPFARWYRTGAVPQSLSLKAATSARTNAPKRAEPISKHPAREPYASAEQSRIAGCEYDHIRRKGESLRSRTVRMRPAQASEPHPPQQGGGTPALRHSPYVQTCRR